MKKAFTILFLSIYVILTVGLNIIVHTCGGESESLLATTTYQDPCGCSDEMESDKCCSTEFTTIKLDDAQKVALDSTLQNLIASEVVLSEFESYDQFRSSEKQNVTVIPISPPPNKDLYISNSVFLI